MDVDFSTQVDGGDTNLLSSIFSGRMRFISRPVVTPVSALSSQCTLQIAAQVEQSSADPSYASNPSASGNTFVFFLLAPRTAGLQSLFSAQFSSSNWNTSTVFPVRLMCVCVCVCPALAGDPEVWQTLSLISGFSPVAFC
jgi:hypothetical protein